MLATDDTHDAVPGEHPDLPLAEEVGKIRRALTARSRVDHGAHPGAGLAQLRREGVALAPCRDDHGALTGAHPLPQQVLHPRAQHDPRPVVVGEDQRVLVPAGGYDQLAAADADHPRALPQGDQAPLVHTEGHRPREDLDLRVSDRPHDQRFDRAHSARFPPRVAAEPFLLLRQDHVGTCVRRGQRRGNARRPAAHDQHVGVAVDLVVSLVGPVSDVHPPQTCRATKHGLVERPEGPRSDEGLVVEAGGKEEGEPVVDRKQVQPERGPGVLMPHVHARLGRGHARPDVGCLTDLHEAVRTAAGAAQQPARAVILEAAGEDSHARPVQRRGDGVPFTDGDRPAVEAEPALVHGSAW